MAVSDSPSDKTASDPALGRRTFLRHSIVSLGATVKEFVKHRDAPSSEETQKTKVPEKTGWLRPPGAVEEDLFLERCTKCGDCIPDPGQCLNCPWNGLLTDVENTIKVEEYTCHGSPLCQRCCRVLINANHRGAFRNEQL